MLLFFSLILSLIGFLFRLPKDLVQIAQVEVYQFVKVRFVCLTQALWLKMFKLSLWMLVLYVKELITCSLIQHWSLTLLSYSFIAQHFWSQLLGLIFSYSICYSHAVWQVESSIIHAFLIPLDQSSLTLHLLMRISLVCLLLVLSR